MKIGVETFRICKVFYLKLFIMKLFIFLYVTAVCLWCLMMLYCFLQLLRTQIIYNIRVRWSGNNDDRYSKYTYDEMFNPKKHNWYGFKIPRNTDY